MKTSTKTLAAALRILALEIQSPDGIANAAIAEAADRIEALEEVVKAVAHIGVDFGYGKYELQPEDIDKARALLDS